MLPPKIVALVTAILSPHSFHQHYYLIQLQKRLITRDDREQTGKLRSEGPTVVSKKSTVIWDVMLCIMVEVYGHFG